MNEEKRSNQGYEIIESRTIGSTEFVIGHNPHAPNPYVCWHCKNGTDYYWGVYVNELAAAKKSFDERCQQTGRFHRNADAKPQKSRDDYER